MKHSSLRTSLSCWLSPASASPSLVHLVVRTSSRRPSLLLAIVTIALTCHGDVASLLSQESSSSPDRTIAELAAEQLPPVRSMTPAESLASLRLREGFKATVVAAEPLVRDPMAVAFDESGRMYVVELPSYNAYSGDGSIDSAVSGLIHSLEDVDQDGLYDKSILFADGLGYPTAIACWDGGLFVGAAPDLLYLKDTDGDGRADQRRVVLTGFGTDASGEGQLNSFLWGFDNRIHISTGLDGGRIHTPDQPASDGVSVRGRGILLDPRDPTKFEVTSGGGQHGMGMDDWGRTFVCSNSVPAQVLMYDDRYVARNPHMTAPSAAVDIARDGKFTRLFRISPGEPWRELRTRLRRDRRFRGSDEGGTPFGFFTGASGISVYRGDAWPAEFRGNLFVGDVANNLVFRANVEPKGVETVADRADANQEFLASRDIWFRPVQFSNAPDGTLYLIDMYRGLIEGAAFLPPEFLDFVDPIAGNDRGRIYRIEPTDSSIRPTQPLGELSTVEVVSLLEHANGWHRDTASRLIYQRQDTSSRLPLRRLVNASASATGRMTALYALAGQAALDQATLLAALDDPHPMVRVHALRLAETLTNVKVVADKLCSMADDQDVRVRYQVAFSVGFVSGISRDQALAKIFARDGTDRWFRLAAHSSVATHADRLFQLLSADQGLRQADHGSQFLVGLAEQIGRTDDRRAVSTVASFVGRLSADETQLASNLTVALIASQSSAARERTLSSHERLQELLRLRLHDALRAATDDLADTTRRVRALRTLRLSPFESVSATCQDLLAIRQPAAVQSAVLKLIGNYQDPEAAQLICRAWPALSPSLRAQAIETLCTRSPWINLMLDTVEQGQIRVGEIEVARIELLKQHLDKNIAERVNTIFAGTTLPRRATIVEQFQAALNLDGDSSKGREVFRKVCSSCHQLEGIGTSVGADLRGIANRGRPAILLNILDPNREVKPKFLAYVAELTDGRTFTGMIESESTNSLQLRQPDGNTAELLRSQIEQLQNTGISFMPEGLEKQLTVPAMADLLAYLERITK